MSAEVIIIGFDRETEMAAFETGVPVQALAQVREIAEVPSTDPDLLGSYPLGERQIALIADVADININPGEFFYFLESCHE